MKTGRRGFLRSGVVLGMAGALVGVGSGSAQAQVAPPSGVPMAIRPWPEMPKPENVTLERVDILPGMQATRYAGYEWRGDGQPPILDPAWSYGLRVLIDGEEYGFNVTRSRPVEG